MLTRRAGAPRARSRWAGLVAAALSVGVTVMLLPVLAAPVMSDERYQYLIVPGRAQGDWWELVRWSIEEIPFRASQGRITPIGFFVQRPFFNGVSELSVATGIPVQTLHGAVKVLLLAVAVACIGAFVRALRGRDHEGRLVGVGRTTTGLVLLAVVVMTAVGAQAHYPNRNAWTVFPVLTYLAVAVVFGLCATVLWLARRTAQRPGVAAGVGAAAVAAVLGVLLNLTYELYFVAFPAALLALLLQPVGEPGDRRGAWRARGLVGGGLAVGFLVTVVVIRSRIAAICAERECYVGVQPELGLGTVRTAVLNLLSALPGSGLAKAADEIGDVGGRTPLPYSTWLVLGCVAAGAALVGARLLASPRLPWDGQGAGEAAALWRGAVVAVAVTGGSAVIMALSVQAQQEITVVGLPYRNTVLTWMSLCLAGALALLALDRRVAPRTGRRLWVAAGVSAAVVGGLVLPSNLAVSRAANASQSAIASTAVHRELTLGDLSPEGAARRCEVLEDLRESPAAERARRTIEEGAQSAFAYFYGRPFCAG